MLKNILLIGISVFSINTYAESYFIKYNDLVSETTITEKFKSADDFSNRIEELKYLNEQSIKILNSGAVKNVNAFKNYPTVDAVMMSGGEGGGS